MSNHPEDVQKQAQQRAFENVTVGGNLSIENLNQIINLVSQSNRKNNNFCELIEWIAEKSDFLENLPAYYGDEILKIINKNIISKQHSISDFTDCEIKVFSLVFNFCHYYLQGRRPRLKEYTKFKKEDYYFSMNELAEKGEKIRRGNVKLSSLIKDKEMSKIVQKVELTDEC